MEKKVNISRDKGIHSDDAEPQGLNRSKYEFDILKDTNKTKKARLRERVNSDPVEVPSKPKKSFHISQIMNTKSNWEQDLNLSLNAELGEANEPSKQDINEEEKNIQDDPEFFYSVHNDNSHLTNEVRKISKCLNVVLLIDTHIFLMNLA